MYLACSNLKVNTALVNNHPSVNYSQISSTLHYLVFLMTIETYNSVNFGTNGKCYLVCSIKHYFIWIWDHYTWNIWKNRRHTAYSLWRNIMKWTTAIMRSRFGEISWIELQDALSLSKFFVFSLHWLIPFSNFKGKVQLKEMLLQSWNYLSSNGHFDDLDKT